MYRIAVCEDENEVREQLVHLLRECTGQNAMLSEYVEAVDLLDEWKRAGRQLQDIIIMDIRFQDENGISVARKIQQKYPFTYVIFVTGYLEYASEIFEADPVYFLVKPVNREKLEMALKKAALCMERNAGTGIWLNIHGKMVILSPGNISYLESRLKEVEIHDNGKVRSLHAKLKEIEDKLPANFIRVHQSYVVNMDYIAGLTRQSVTLKDGTLIPVSRSRFPEAKDAFINYLHGQM